MPDKITYKSSSAKVFLCWIKSSLAIAFSSTIATVLPFSWLDMRTETFFAILPFILCISVAIAAYLAFSRWNIIVEVSTPEVVLSRGKKPYLQLSLSENTITSLEDIQLRFPVKTTSFFLRVFPCDAEYGKDHKLHNFSRQSFEACMAHIRAIQYEKTLQQEVLVVDPEEYTEENSEVISVEDWLKQSISALKTNPLEFSLNKHLHVKRAKTVFQAIAIPMGIITALLAFGVLVLPIMRQDQNALDHMAISVSYILFLVAIFGGLVIGLGWLPYRRAKNANTPEKITAYHDRINLDDRTFMYASITEIKMITPNITGDRVFRRALTISEWGQTITYELGDSRDSLPDTPKKQRTRVFAEYHELFATLQNIFAIQAKEEGGESRFRTSVQ